MTLGPWEPLRLDGKTVTNFTILKALVTWQYNLKKNKKYKRKTRKFSFKPLQIKHSKALKASLGSHPLPPTATIRVHCMHCIQCITMHSVNNSALQCLTCYTSALFIVLCSGVSLSAVCITVQHILCSVHWAVSAFTACRAVRCVVCITV